MCRLILLLILCGNATSHPKYTETIGCIEVNTCYDWRYIKYQNLTQWVYVPIYTQAILYDWNSIENQYEVVDFFMLEDVQIINDIPQHVRPKDYYFNITREYTTFGIVDSKRHLKYQTKCLKYSHTDTELDPEKLGKRNTEIYQRRKLEFRK